MWKKIYKLMVLQRKTAYQVSKETGISQTAFSNWKAGIAKPSTKNLLALAKYFKVPLEYFFEEESEVNS